MLAVPMARVPITARMLLLVPLLAAGVDLTRATVLCGTGAQTCLEAAGRGWLGPVAGLLVVLYAAAGGLLLARGARRRATVARAGFASAWAQGTVALAAVCAGQDLLARVLGDGATGGFSAGLLGACALGGALLALALRAGAAAAELVAELAPRAPRGLVRTVARLAGVAPPPEPVLVAVDGTRRGRAPPS